MRCGNNFVLPVQASFGHLEGSCGCRGSLLALLARRACSRFKVASTGLPNSFQASLYSALSAGFAPLASFAAMMAGLAPLLLFPTQSAVAAGGHSLLVENIVQTDQKDRGSFHIGTFQTRPGEAAIDGGHPSRRGGLSHEEPYGESFAEDLGLSAKALQSPSELLSIALSDLKADHRVRARRCLELLVARFPNSVAADTARGHLARLYAHGHDGAEGSGSNGKIGLATQRVHEGGMDSPLLHDVNTNKQNLPTPAVNNPLSRALGLAVGDRVFFAPNSDKLGSKAVNVLRAQALWLKQRAGLSVLVSGYADEPGDAERNFVLSQRRALSVMDRLIKEGVAKQRIRVVAYGRRSPIATCSRPVCAAQNRRVVTRILEHPSSRAELKVKIKREQ